jgi:hypothetical protein
MLLTEHTIQSRKSPFLKLKAICNNWGYQNLQIPVKIQETLTPCNPPPKQKPCLNPNHTLPPFLTHNFLIKKTQEIRRQTCSRHPNGHHRSNPHTPRIPLLPKIQLQLIPVIDILVRDRNITARHLLFASHEKRLKTFHVGAFEEGFCVCAVGSCCCLEMSVGTGKGGGERTAATGQGAILFSWIFVVLHVPIDVSSDVADWEGPETY